jgi:hypothetical protein
MMRHLRRLSAFLHLSFGILYIWHLHNPHRVNSFIFFPDGCWGSRNFFLFTKLQYVESTFSNPDFCVIHRSNHRGRITLEKLAFISLNIIKLITTKGIMVPRKMQVRDNPTLLVSKVTLPIIKKTKITSPVSINHAKVVM